ncbi:hypothetical protein AB0393_09370 [Streptomyces cyaneofuscatus]|uniref:hypothetical protein n=1 Tax=Streptomyces TaxID=1883 RepID=UPI00344DF06B
MSAVPFAEGTATLSKLKALDGPALFERPAGRLTKGLEGAAADHGLTLVTSGAPALFPLRLEDEAGSLTPHQEWVAECVRRGVFLSSHHNHFVDAALTDDDIDRTVEVAHEAFGIVRSRHPELVR